MFFRGSSPEGSHTKYVYVFHGGHAVLAVMHASWRIDREFEASYSVDRLSLSSSIILKMCCGLAAWVYLYIIRGCLHKHFFDGALLPTSQLPPPLSILHSDNYSSQPP